MGDPAIFDFSRVFDDREDLVVRTIDTRDEDRWIDVLVTPSGHTALWNWSRGFDTAEEAIAWLKTINAE